MLKNNILLILFFCALPHMVLATEPLIVDRFDEGLLAWEVKKFSGETIYAVQIDGNGNSVLSARSKASASGLLKHIEFDPEKYPVLTWRWKIARTLSKGDARSKQGDDYAARIYVIFPHWIKPLSRTINYIWANRLPVEEAVSSPYLSRDMMLAVESGDNKAGQWVSEERNLVADFRR
ncbi:MAG: DUF3047 domain-containing protein, partial [Deltaproteobacteria bacterium]|nr:DUF3047 domain-containing protein [Deltaproteobacteria bacterium]